MNTKDAIRLTLIDLMDARNVSGKELAEAVGVSKQAVSSWRTGKSSIDIDNVPAICEFFNVSFDEFFGNKDVSGDNTAVSLTEDEIALIRFFRHLSIYQKAGLFWSLGRMSIRNDEYPSTDSFKRENDERIPLNEVFESGFLPYPIDNVEAFESGKIYAMRYSGYPPEVIEDWTKRNRPKNRDSF